MYQINLSAKKILTFREFFNIFLFRTAKMGRNFVFGCLVFLFFFILNQVSQTILRVCRVIYLIKAVHSWFVWFSHQNNIYLKKKNLIFTNVVAIFCATCSATGYPCFSLKCFGYCFVLFFFRNSFLTVSDVCF